MNPALTLTNPERFTHYKRRRTIFLLSPTNATGGRYSMEDFPDYGVYTYTKTGNNTATFDFISTRFPGDNSSGPLRNVWDLTFTGTGTNLSGAFSGKFYQLGGDVANLSGPFVLNQPPPDLQATSLAWSADGGLDFVFTVVNFIASPTSAKLFWANGPFATNKLTSSSIYSYSIQTEFTGQSLPIHLPSSGLPPRPAGATHILLEVDPEDTVVESSTNNNVTALNITLPDLVVGTLGWDNANPGLRFTYACIPGNFPISASSAKIFWATGASITNRIASPVLFAQSIPAGFTGLSSPIFVPISNFANRPPSATHILLVVDPDNVVWDEGSEKNNSSTIAIVRPDLRAFPPVWEGVNARLEFVCSVDPGSLGIASSTIKLFWANGSALTNRIVELPEISSRSLPATFSGQMFTSYVHQCDYQFPPAGATHVLMAADFGNLISEASEANNISAIALAETVQWNNSGSGSYTEASNWIPQKVPGALDTVIFSSSGAEPVIIDFRDGPQCGSMTFNVSGIRIAGHDYIFDLTAGSAYGQIRVSKAIKVETVGASLSLLNGICNAPEIGLPPGARLILTNSYLMVSNVPSAVLNGGISWGWQNGSLLIETNLHFTSSSSNVIELRSSGNNSSTPLFRIGDGYKFRAGGRLEFKRIGYEPKAGDRFRLVEFKSETQVPEEIDNFYRFHNYNPEVPGSPDLIWGLAFRQEGGVRFGEGPQFIELLVLEKPKHSISKQRLDPSGRDGLVFVTHGTKASIGDDLTKDFAGIAAGIKTFLTSRFVTRWDVVTFDWRDQATQGTDYNPATSAQVGIGIAESLHHWMTNSGFRYKDMHLLSHSSGSWLVNRIRQLEKGAAVHLTLFDAYTSPGKPFSSDYPFFAERFHSNLGAAQGPDDFVEHYVDKGSLPGTGDRLPNAVNFDVTRAQIPSADRGWDFISQHSWPYIWYLETIRFANDDVETLPAAHCAGFFLSPEFLEASPGYGSIRDYKDNLKNGMEIKIEQDSCVETKITPTLTSYGAGFENIIIAPVGLYGTTPGGGIWMTTSFPNQENSPPRSPIPSPTSPIDLQATPTLPWAAITNHVVLPHDTVEFGFAFQFGGNATGILSVLADGEIVAVFEQTWTGTNWISTEPIVLQNPLVRGNHQLVFLLQSVSDAPVSVTLSDLSFGYSPASILLSPRISEDGLIELAIQGVPNRVYSLERSTAVTGPWTNVGYVTVGPTGLGTVLETSLVGSQIFYRAFASVPLATFLPKHTTNVIGTSITLAPVISGTPPFYFQWFKDGAPIIGQTNATLEIAALSLQHAGSYSLVVSNGYGTAEVDVSTVTIVAAPLITSQPAAQSVPTGEQATFSVSVIGHMPMNYQWRKGGVNLTDSGRLSGTTTSTLTVSNTKRSDSGDYDVVISNSFGMVTSQVATLSVPMPPQWPATNGGTWCGTRRIAISFSRLTTVNQSQTGCPRWGPPRIQKRPRSPEMRSSIAPV